jgi:hypothetical protein
MLKKYVKLFLNNINKVKSDNPITLEFTVSDIDNLVKLMSESHFSL